MFGKNCLLTVRETAEVLHVSTRTVSRMLADEQLRAVKVRGAVRIPMTAISALTEQPMQKEVDAND